MLNSHANINLPYGAIPMSYLTTHNLTIEEGGPQLSQVAAMLAETVNGKPPKHPDHKRCASRWESILEGEPAKWDESGEAMMRVSRRWPFTLFTMHGQGEDHDDRWVAYHVNGQEQVERQPLWTPPPPHLNLGKALSQPERSASPWTS